MKIEGNSLKEHATESIYTNILFKSVKYNLLHWLKTLAMDICIRLFETSKHTISICNMQNEPYTEW